MTGDQDNLSEPARQKILARHIPGAKQVIFSDTGHAINVEKPDEFNRALLEFLAE
jgi:pimeloyl-ACP methyl ester carboxylesterase